MLTNCAITAVAHCAPPHNKPTPQELAACSRWLEMLLDLQPARVFLPLGQIAWRSVCQELRRRAWLPGRNPRFTHGQRVPLADDRLLLGSYHPSQQNTFTGRLTAPMLDEVFAAAARHIGQQA